MIIGNIQTKLVELCRRVSQDGKAHLFVITCELHKSFPRDVATVNGDILTLTVEFRPTTQEPNAVTST